MERGALPRPQDADVRLYKARDDDVRSSLIEYEAALLDEKQNICIAERAESVSSLEAGTPDALGAAVVVAEEYVMDFTATRLVLICLAQVGVSAVSLTYLSILLPGEVLVVFGSGSKGSILGALSAAGGVLSIFGPPLIGMASDNNHSRFGRRKPYMLAGIIVTTLGLGIGAWTSASMTVGSMLSVYFLVTMGSMLHSTSFNATIPEFPDHQFGTVSGVVGALTIVGFCVGAGLGAASTSIGAPATYYALAFILVLTGVLTLVFYEDTVLQEAEAEAEAEVVSDDGLPRRPRKSGTAAAAAAAAGGENDSEEEGHGPRPHQDARPGDAAVKVNKWWGGRIAAAAASMAAPLATHDFRWVFITRLLVQFGVFTVQEFALFWVEDVLPVEGLTSTTRAAVLFVPLFIGAFVSSIIVGKVSDAYGGKRKVFLITSSLVMGTVCFAVGFMRSYYVALVFMLFFGCAMGTFLALDYALICDVLPNKDHLARDLGVWHISIVLPQLVAAPMAGALLDALQRTGRQAGMPYVGYTVIFSLAALYFLTAGACFTLLRSVK